jgi:ATP synthase protein I
MANKERPGETGKPGPERTDGTGGGDEDLERRRLQLEAKLATRRPASRDGKDAQNPSSKTGFGNALKLSSEFVAAILVGVGIGWVLDYWAGTSPWGLIVFLFLGFAAGVLNVMRSAGTIAEHGSRTPPEKNGSG